MNIVNWLNNVNEGRKGKEKKKKKRERGTLMVLTVAGGEAAVGLAVLVVYYRVHGTIAMESMNVLHG